MRLFGTDGIRCRAGTAPLTHEGLITLGHALAQWLCGHTDAAKILIGQDTRSSGAGMSNALIEGLCHYDVSVHTAGILPTPAVSYLVQTQHFDLGIMITASHNPAHDNGIKLITPHGKLSPSEEEAIEILVAAYRPEVHVRRGSHRPYPQAQKNYTTYLTTQMAAQFLAGKKIVLDCAHGATAHLAPDIFRAYGADVIEHGTAPDGRNINAGCGALAPEALQTLVRSHHAFLGCAFDGDGDRLVVVTQDGTILSGEDILVTLLAHEDYKNQPALVSTSMANYGLTRYLETRNKEFIQTDVGDKHIVHALRTHGLLLGGEPSGHIIMNNHLATGDGILAALKVLETLIAHSLSEPLTITKVPSVQVNVPVTRKLDLATEPFASTLNTLRRDLTGRLLVRYSGTEALVRILAESPDKELAQYTAHKAADFLRTQLYKEPS